ncbi:MAG: tetratricopeptide repeat protein [Synechococcales cyanobacterium RM1_1_8]|nr:tetratricopeptide repeat protein [Synechococcales cyanobacterium RM1_1_8]
MVVCVISFLGLSIAPLLGNAFQRSSSPEPEGQTDLSQSDEQLLRDQAKGFELVLQREPGNQTALRSLMDIRLQLGEIDAVIPHLEKFAELNQDNGDYTILLAQVKQQTGDSEGAAQTYRQLLEANPGNLKALQGLVALLLQENRPTAAVSLLQDTLKLAPEANEAKPGTIDKPSVQLILGQVYTEQNRYADAVDIYDQVQAENAEDFRPVLAKAIVLKTEGKQAADYEPLFEQAIALAPDEYKDQIQQMATATNVSGGSAAPNPGATGNAAPDSPAPPSEAQGETSPAVPTE